MTETLMETKALPEPLFSMFHTDKIRIFQENDVIRLIPVETDEDPASARRQAHRVAFEKFVKAMAEIDDEPLDEKFDVIISGGLKFRTRELDL
ncbi:MAG: hypothetical protein LBH03_05795 [Holophagales bacterium]|nr:hypothetical protein [Holophagales bacterium]